MSSATTIGEVESEPPAEVSSMQTFANLADRAGRQVSPGNLKILRNNNDEP
jgi:hypothetical protein